MNRAEHITRSIRGFIVPIFSEKLPDGTTLNGVTDREMQMIAEGYACGECMAIFSHYTVTCPVCGLSRDVTADVQSAPQLWLDHLADRAREDAPATRSLSFDEAMGGAMKNADVTELGKRPRRKP